MRQTIPFARWRILASAAPSLLVLVGCADAPTTSALVAAPAAAEFVLAGTSGQFAVAQSGLDDAAGRLAPSLERQLHVQVLSDALTAANVAIAAHDARAFERAVSRAEGEIARLAASDKNGESAADLDVLRLAITDARALLVAAPAALASTGSTR